MKPEYRYRVELVKIVDGDTIDVKIDLGFYTYVVKRLRLLDIDTYEVRGGTAETKLLGHQATEYVRELFSTSDDVVIETEMDATGKYGRVLAHVYLQINGDWFSLSTMLRLKGYADEAVPDTVDEDDSPSNVNIKETRYTLPNGKVANLVIFTSATTKLLPIAIDQYMNGEPCYEFIVSDLTNSFTRLIITNIDDLADKPFHINDSK
jgi:endonuclease YncB( thermonuclease family)